MPRLRAFLGEPVDAATLGLFRCLWGLLMFLESAGKYPKAATTYAPDRFHFRYAHFEWVEPLPSLAWTQFEILTMAMAALGIAAGVGFRVSCALFGLAYTHLFLVEKLDYNNHYYLVILVTLLLGVSQAQRAYSLPKLLERWRGNPERSDATAPFWNYFLLRTQLAIVYLFGGLAKLNADWLQGEPLRYWFRTREAAPPVGWVLHEECFVWVISYGGIAFDLAIPFLLLGRRSFPIGFVLLVAFHLTNFQIFQIGLFPWMGIASAAIFLAPGAARRASKPSSPAVDPSLASVGATAFVALYLALQVALPLRHHLYGANAGWTEVGHGFAWRMMLRHKDSWGALQFVPADGEAVFENSPHRPRLAAANRDALMQDPHFTWQWARAVRRTLLREGRSDVEVRAVAVVSMNGRPYQLAIDPRVDLGRATYDGWGVPHWILPLEPEGVAGTSYPRDSETRGEQIQRAVDEGFARVSPST